MLYRASYTSPLGEMYMFSDGKFLTELDFVDVLKKDGAAGKAALSSPLPVFAAVKRWLDCYFQGICPDFVPPLSLQGSSFQREVWEILRGIPYGETVCYGDIAAEVAGRLGKERMSAQAVGGAVGRNPIAILVPCHRVVGKDGSLTGYAGGLWRKKYLLALEGWEGKRQELP